MSHGPSELWWQPGDPRTASTRPWAVPISVLQGRAGYATDFGLRLVMQGSYQVKGKLCGPEVLAERVSRQRTLLSILNHHLTSSSHTPLTEYRSMAGHLGSTDSHYRSL